jgi:hypothetical protein
MTYNEITSRLQGLTKTTKTTPTEKSLLHPTSTMAASYIHDQDSLSDSEASQHSSEDEYNVCMGDSSSEASFESHEMGSDSDSHAADSDEEHMY